jgi:hypothetical protein
LTRKNAVDRAYPLHERPIVGAMVEAWETSAGGPYVTIEATSGTVTLWTLGKEQVRVVATGALDEEHVVHGGHREAQQLAHEIVDRLAARVRSE